DRAAPAGRAWSGGGDGVGHLASSRDDRYRRDGRRSAALGWRCGRAAYRLDAPGRRRVVEYVRAPDGRSGGGERVKGGGRQRTVQVGRRNLATPRPDLAYSGRFGDLA